MNERIRELAEQARKYADENRSGSFVKYDPEWFVLYNKKFAELIVAHATECVRDVLREEDSELTYTAAAQVQNRIKEFFGVEE
jgi:hypothetical protein